MNPDPPVTSNRIAFDSGDCRAPEVPSPGRADRGRVPTLVRAGPLNRFVWARGTDERSTARAGDRAQGHAALGKRSLQAPRQDRFDQEDADEPERLRHLAAPPGPGLEPEAHFREATVPIHDE